MRFNIWDLHACQRSSHSEHPRMFWRRNIFLQGGLQVGRWSLADDYVLTTFAKPDPKIIYCISNPSLLIVFSCSLAFFLLCRQVRCLRIERVTVWTSCRTLSDFKVTHIRIDYVIIYAEYMSDDLVLAWLTWAVVILKSDLFRNKFRYLARTWATTCNPFD